MQRDEKMYLWLEEMGLINEPKKERDEQLKEFEQNLRLVMIRNKLIRRRRNDTLISRGRAV